MRIKIWHAQNLEGNVTQKQLPTYLCIVSHSAVLITKMPSDLRAKCSIVCIHETFNQVTRREWQKYSMDYEDVPPYPILLKFADL